MSVRVLKSRGPIHVSVVNKLDRYAVSAEELVLLHGCLSSKLCMRIFKILCAERGALNISAICRKAGCTNNNALRHLRRLVKLGVAEEKLLTGLHTFKIKRGGMAELLIKAERFLEAEPRSRSKSRRRGYMQLDRSAHPARKPQSPAAYNPKT